MSDREGWGHIISPPPCKIPSILAVYPWVTVTIQGYTCLTKRGVSGNAMVQARPPWRRVGYTATPGAGEALTLVSSAYAAFAVYVVNTDG